MSGDDIAQSARALEGLAGSPVLYPQKYDPVREGTLLIRMSAADYRSASFLDDRILTAKTQGFWAPQAMLEKAATATGRVKPLHFIFHTGHVGSTLLSRLLDEAAPVLPVREPLPLRTLAEAHDILDQSHSFLSGGAFAQRLKIFLQLWSRGFPETEAVILKATSSAGRMAPVLLAACSGAKAVYLNLAAEPYLATLLAGANAELDLRGHAQGRIQRLERRLGQPPLILHKASIGELAAMSWLAETLAQEQTVAAAGLRVLRVDFDRMLGCVEETVTDIAAHFGLTVPASKLSSLATSPVLTRYSKAPEHSYSPALRAELLAQARRECGVELRKGMAWLEGMAKRHDTLAGVLASR